MGSSLAAHFELSIGKSKVKTESNWFILRWQTQSRAMSSLPVSHSEHWLVSCALAALFALVLLGAGRNNQVCSKGLRHTRYF
jgi:hypothetical protein